MIFKNRFDAGYQLAQKLIQYKDNKETVILTIPRGALQISYILAKELNLPLDIILTKKIPAPGNPEFAIGSASLESYIIDPDYNLPQLQNYFKNEVQKIREMIEERYRLYKGNQKPINLHEKIVILTDDGIATGKTVISAIELIKKQNPKKIIVAVPVASVEAIRQINKIADEVVCLYVPEIFYAVGQFYENFDQVEDEEAIKLLNEANKK